MRRFSLSATVLLGAVAVAQNPTDIQGPLPPAGQPIRCLTVPNLNGQTPWDHPDCDLFQTNPSATYAPTFLYRIPVVVHVIQNTSGQGNLSDTLVRSQIDILNEDFRARAGTLGAAGTDTMIEFFLATTDPAGNPTTGIRRYTNNTWFNDGGSYWNSIAWNTQRYLNIYTNNASGALGYVPDLPQGGSVLNTNADRVVILWSAFGRNAPGGPPYNQGRTCTHEVGHYLGLFHTFDNGCGSTSACFTSGDRICDTNPEANPRFGCPTSATSCGSLDPVRNYMDYTDDTCMNNFTAQQARRMRCTIQHYRPNLAVIGNCSNATATVRNAGSNPNIYQGGLLRIGQIWQGVVILAGTGYQFAALYGFLGGANVPIGGGLHLLMDLGTPQLLSLPFNGNGIVASFNFTMPNDTGFCGLPLTTQALLFGGPPNFSLTNAVDLVVGL